MMPPSTPLVRRMPSPLSILVATLICTGCALCCIAVYATSTVYGLVADSVGFLKIGASQLVLPACLTLVCTFRVQYTSLEMVRVAPPTQLIRNLKQTGVICMLTALAGVTLFALVVSVRTGIPTGAELHALAVTFLLTFLMNASVCLLVLLFASFGLSWINTSIILMAFYVIANWLLLPLAGDAARYVCYFWYPVSMDWPVILLLQVIPFIGYCTLLLLVIGWQATHRDRLEL